MVVDSWQLTDRMCWGIYTLSGSVLAAVVSLVVREGAVCLVALRDGCCDNDDVTFDSIFLFLYIGILCWIYNVGAFWQPWCRSWLERAQFARSRFVTGAATMTTRHFNSFRSYILGDV